MQRIGGILRLTCLAVLELLVLCSFGLKVAGLLLAIMFFYGFAGGWIALLKARAIPLRDADPLLSQQVNRAIRLLRMEAEKHGEWIPNIKVYVLPADTINAFSYSGSRIGITQGLLRACDDTSIASVLAHEVSHSIALDPIVHRLAFANIVLLTLTLSFFSVVASAGIWIIFIILALMGSAGFIAYFVFRLSHGAVRGIFTLLQRLFIFIYRLSFGLISRRCEYRADLFAAKLGFAPALSFFLQKIDRNELEWSLDQALYADHPPIYKRIRRLKQAECKITHR